MKEIDLHGYELSEAFIEIIYALKECRDYQESRIELIHGYKSGQVLKNYIQSKKFISQMKKEGFHIKRIKASNRGATRFKILN